MEQLSAYMTTGTIITAAAIVVALLVVAAIVASMRRHRSARLRDEFGPEYDHLVESKGSRSRAEQELAARRQRAEQMPLRSLTAAERESFARDWEQAEARFLERPATAVVLADELIMSIMAARGYDGTGFESRVGALSVRNPQLAADYRSAHETLGPNNTAPSTEELRQAMVKFRRLYEMLAGQTDTVQSISSERELSDDPATRRDIARRIDEEARFRH